MSAAYSYVFFFSNHTATPQIYTLSLHDALPIRQIADFGALRVLPPVLFVEGVEDAARRGEIRRITTAGLVDVKRVCARQNQLSRQCEADQHLAAAFAQGGRGHRLVAVIANLGCGADGWRLRHGRAVEPEERQAASTRAHAGQEQASLTERPGDRSGQSADKDSSAFTRAVRVTRRRAASSSKWTVTRMLLDR